jgi:hypothetical protein
MAASPSPQAGDGGTVNARRGAVRAVGTLTPPVVLASLPWADGPPSRPRTTIAGNPTTTLISPTLPLSSAQVTETPIHVRRRWHDMIWVVVTLNADLLPVCGTGTMQEQ